MLDIHKINYLYKKAFTPVTIMVIPHDTTRFLNIKIPFIGIFISIILCILGSFLIFQLAVNTLEYRSMEKRVVYYSKQFCEWKSTISALKKVEEDFRRLFSLGSKEKILENMDSSFSGSVDIQTLKLELEKSIETVEEIKDYLRLQKDLYLATPKGWPVVGNITSGYGKRGNPFNGGGQFHAGIDISSSPGSPVRVTADGVVSYCGWAGESGNLVVLEHGYGFSTLYAHNKKNMVKVGQKVKRGDIIAYLGSTGKSTGPHVHYEVWKNGRSINPQEFFRGRP